MENKVFLYHHLCFQSVAAWFLQLCLLWINSDDHFCLTNVCVYTNICVRRGWLALNRACVDDAVRTTHTFTGKRCHSQSQLVNTDEQNLTVTCRMPWRDEMKS